MGKFIEMLCSRKWLHMIAEVALPLFGWMHGDIPATIAIPAIMAAISVWIHAQGKVDAAERTTGAGFMPDNGVDVQ